MTSEVDSEIRREIARWTHLWASAATHTLRNLRYEPASPASSIGAMDALALVIIDAVRNTYRGACVVLGTGNAAVSRFEEELPTVKALRDRLEHFDAYLRGDGNAQKADRRAPALELDSKVGLTIKESSGGGPGGHTIAVKVHELAGEVTYVLETQQAVDAARRLAREVLDAEGLLDERHRRACDVCLQSLAEHA